MKIFIANDSKQGMGGGWSFIRNFVDGLRGTDGVIVSGMNESDVVFIPSSSMVKAETVELAKQLKKPIILRIDNIPRNSRNRNTGTSRLKAYADAASVSIFQSEWALDFVGGWLLNRWKESHKWEIVFNGVDTDIFNPNGPKESDQRGVYLYSRINRDETKNWHVAWYEYQMVHRAWEQSDKESAPPELWLTGQFSPELVEYNFDFFQGEVVRYFGAIEDQRLYARILRSASYLLAPYYNDACSNSIIEALASGVSVETLGWGHTGGTPELFKLHAQGFDWSHKRMAREYLSLMEFYG